MQGTFAFPFAEAESVMLTLARDLDAQADAMVAPEGFQGRTARALAGAQAERRATLNQLTESAYEAAAISGTQNTADEALAAAPSPEVVAAQEAKVRAMTAALDVGIGSVAAVMYENRILDDLLMRRQLALTVHAAESERTTGCFGRLDFPEAAAPRPVPFEPGSEPTRGREGEWGEAEKKKLPTPEVPSPPPPTDESPPT
ncbi:MAG: hypothetical protein NTV19_01730, partial [Burkholderiales bacterium]|nr:hypothetical protein [Burkholderiales bacterium]